MREIMRQRREASEGKRRGNRGKERAEKEERDDEDEKKDDNRTDEKKDRKQLQLVDARVNRKCSTLRYVIRNSDSKIQKSLTKVFRFSPYLIGTRGGL